MNYAVLRKLYDKSVHFLIVASALFGLLVGPFIVYKFLSDPTAGIPAVDELVVINGKIDWIESGDYGVHFGLDGYSMSFVYHSKAGGLQQVSNALSLHQGKQAEVMVKLEDAHGPMDSAIVDLHVFQLVIDGIVIRTYEQTSKAWLQDNKVAPYIGIFFTLAGLILGHHSMFRKSDIVKGEDNE